MNSCGNSTVSLFGGIPCQPLMSWSRQYFRRIRMTTTEIVPSMPCAQDFQRGRKFAMHQRMRSSKRFDPQVWLIKKDRASSKYCAPLRKSVEAWIYHSSQIYL